MLSVIFDINLSRSRKVLTSRVAQHKLTEPMAASQMRQLQRFVQRPKRSVPLPNKALKSKTPVTTISRTLKRTPSASRQKVRLLHEDELLGSFCQEWLGSSVETLRELWKAVVVALNHGLAVPALGMAVRLIVLE